MKPGIVIEQNYIHLIDSSAVDAMLTWHYGDIVSKASVNSRMECVEITACKQFQTVLALLAGGIFTDSSVEYCSVDVAIHSAGCSRCVHHHTDPSVIINTKMFSMDNLV